jgi:hypothetical protein
VRLYPEDIERLFSKTPVGTPGEFTYQPVKFGWRGDALYAEVHDDLYGKYPGLWNLASQEVQRRHLEGQVDMVKLEKMVEARSGIPTYIGFGPDPAGALIPPDATGTVAATAPVGFPASGTPDAAAAYSPAPPTAPRVHAAESGASAKAPTEPGVVAADSADSASADSADSRARPLAPPPPRAEFAGPPRAAAAPGLSSLPTSIVTAPDSDDDAGGDWEKTR